MKRVLISLLFGAAAALAQISGAGQLGCNAAPITGTAATSATSNNTVLATVNPVISPQIIVTLDQTSTITGGVVTFQGDYGDGNFVNVPVAQVLAPSTGLPLTNPYTLVASTNQPFLILMNGFVRFQVKLTTAITGSATVTPFTVMLCYNPSSVALGQATMAASVPVALASNQSNLPVVGVGTAGTPSGGVASVQGVSGGQAVPISGAVSQTSGPWTQNLTQVNGASVALGQTTMSASLPVTFASNQGAIAAAGQGATGSAVPSGANYHGGIATTAYPAAATPGNLVGAMFDKAGRMAVVAGTVRDLVGSVGVQSTSATASQLIAAGATGVFNDIMSLTCTTESASTATIVTISDNGTGGNAYKFNIGGTAGSGLTVNFPTPLPQGTSAAAWDILNSAAVTLDCAVEYAKNK
jgi:hypothetical protein